MRSILFLRGYNYFYFSLLAIFVSFSPVYFSEMGISKTRIGLMIGVGSFIGILSQPLWGAVSDKFKTVKKLMVFNLIISIGIGTYLFQSGNPRVLFMLVLLMYFFFLSTDALSETLNVQISRENKVSYGSIRMYGALGLGTTSLLVGYLSHLYGLHFLSFLFFGLGIIAVLLFFGIPDAPVSDKPALWKDFKSFFLHSNTVSFFLLVLLAAIPHRMNDTFIGVYIQSLGGDVQLVGLSWFLMAVSEVIFFAISYRFIKPGNELKIIRISAGFYAIRFLLSAIIQNPLGIVLLQVFQGWTFVLFYSAAIQYLYTIIPAQWKATGQTVLAVMFFGVSGIIGSTLGGWVFDTMGGSFLYLMMALVSGLSFLFSIAIQKFQSKKAVEGRTIQ